MSDMSSANSKKKASQKGFALVVVIVVMLMVSFLASELIMLVRTELKISYNIKARVSGHFLAEAGISLGLFRLLGQRPVDIPSIGLPEDWEDKFYEGYEYEVYIPDGKVTYYVTDESGKIDLNKSSSELLRLFLEFHLGEDQEEQINDILASLLDWKDSDDLYRDIGGRGAESETYGELDDPYIARNGAIQDPSEFFLIHATEPLFGKFSPDEVFTVHNSGRKINYNSLTPAMLEFLTAGNKESVEAYREAKREFSGKIPLPVMIEIMGEFQYEKLRPFLVQTASSKFYTIVGKGYLGVTQEEDLVPSDHDQSKKKMPGTLTSMLIEKNGVRYSTRAWQEQFI